MKAPPFFRVVSLVCLATGAAGSAAAQDNEVLRRAVRAYDDLRYADAVVLGRRAVAERLTASEQRRAWELLAFSHASLDSVRLAVDAFKQLLVLDPDRELDARRISPKITSAFTAALAQILVVRGLTADTVTLVAGQDSMPIAFEVTRTARVVTRLVSPTGSFPIDSALHEGNVVLSWNGLVGNAPPPDGGYRLVVEATAGRDHFAVARAIRIASAPVDTLPHLRELPGYTLRPETVTPPRSWRPLGLALLGSAVIAGGAIALENGDLKGGGRREILVATGGVALVGLLATLRRPAPEPADANILYNNLVREQLSRRNAEIAAENAVRRRQVRLTITPLPRGADR